MVQHIRRLQFFISNPPMGARQICRHALESHRKVSKSPENLQAQLELCPPTPWFLTSRKRQRAELFCTLTRAKAPRADACGSVSSASHNQPIGPGRPLAPRQGPFPCPRRNGGAFASLTARSGFTLMECRTLSPDHAALASPCLLYSYPVSWNGGCTDADSYDPPRIPRITSIALFSPRLRSPSMAGDCAGGSRR